MSFWGNPPSQSRKPYAEVLPDGRHRYTRFFKIQTTGIVPPELDYAVASVDPWTTDAPSAWSTCLLTYKQFRDAERGFPQGAEDASPIVQLIYEEIAATGETPVGASDQTELTDGRVQVVDTWVQFHATTFVPQTINVSSVTAAGGATCYLFLEETDDDGTLRQIKRTYQSAGTVATDDESLQGGALLLKKITSFHTVPATPSGYTSVGTPVQNPNGYPIYTYTFAKGAGLVVDEIQTISTDALIVYHRIALGTAPTTPSATIGGTVTLFDSTVIQEDGYVKYDYRWAEGDGQNSITTEGQADGALDYRVTTYTLAASTPSYPGGGTGYLILLTQTAETGYFRNIAVYRKPPATLTFKKHVNFTKPGNVVFTVSTPFQVLEKSQVTMTLLADVEVSYSTSQVTTTPFTVSTWASYYASWIPYTNPGVSPTPGVTPTDTTTGTPRQNQISYGGYLCSSDSISGTDDFFNGVFCASYEATLIASAPTSFSVPATYTLSVDNDPYLVNLSGTVVYRRSVTTYAFP